MLEIKNIFSKTKDGKKEILKDLSLTIQKGEIHAIMGPNGVGKSTLSKVIMGHSSYQVTSGTITFQGQDLLSLSTDERARLGIYYIMQDPAQIEGVTNSECLRTALRERTGEPVNLYQFIKEMNENITSLKMDKSMIHRSINQGFSGGEKKKNEVLQLKMLKPKFILLDELDSGLDVDSLKIVCQNINDYLKENKDTSVLMITHYSRILDLIKPDYVHEMLHGTIVKTGDITLAKEIEKNGYLGLDGLRENEGSEHDESE